MAKRKNTLTEEIPTIVVGLDIGTTKIATIIGYISSDGKIEVLGHGKAESTGVQHGLIYNLNRTIDGINQSVSIAKNRAECEVTNVYVGVAGRHINSSEYRHVMLRKNGREEVIRQEEIDKMTEDLKTISVGVGEKIIDVIPQKFFIDNNTEREVIDPVGELGERIVGFFQLITGNESEIRKIIKCVEEASLIPSEIILEPLASSMVCLTQEEKKQGVVLVDIGGGTTDVAIYMDGNPVFTKVIPFGGNVITKDISSVCQITEEIAEKLKIHHGTCVVEKSNQNNFITIPQFQQSDPIKISEHYLAKIIFSRVQQDILDNVKRAIDESGYSRKIMSIVLTGGGATLRHIKELAQYTLQKPTRIGIPDIGFSALPPELKHPMYATGLGLLKYGTILNNQKGTIEGSEDGVFVKNSHTGEKDKTSKSIFKQFKNYISDLLDNISEKTE
jgi:cell division protein FtsA